MLFYFPVDAGHRAVIFDRFRGVQDTVVGEGTHFLIPWVQKPIIFDCRSRPRNIPVITGSKGELLDWAALQDLGSLMCRVCLALLLLCSWVNRCMRKSFPTVKTFIIY